MGRQCKDCKWLDMSKKTSVGYPCKNTNRLTYGGKLSHLKAPTTPACKTGFEQRNVRHEIKILPQYFELVVAPRGGVKRFELRKDDRGYQAGDSVTLREWDGKEYTGNEITVGIKYILRDCPEYGLMEGYCIFGW